jgi:hypothetical protein
MREYFVRYINQLSSYFKKIESNTNPPVFINDPQLPRFRYENPTRIEVAIMKAARYISGLNSSIGLLYEGYTQELGVICRILQEIFDDVFFLLDGYPNDELTKNQQRYIDEFLQEEFDHPDDPVRSTQKRDRIARKNIFKVIGKILSDFTSYDHAKELDRTLYQAYSGYVHCAYHHIMEMYGGSPPRYHLNGMKGTPRINEWEENTKHYIHRGFNLLLEIAQKMNLRQLVEEIRKSRKFFERELNYLNKE